MYTLFLFFTFSVWEYLDVVIIIDAYNLLHACFRTTFEHDKESFIKRLERYSLKAHKKCIAVFDGGSFSLPSSSHIHAYFQIVYSGCSISADFYIINTLKRKDGIDYVVVSYDREILSYARAGRYATLEPSLFWDTVKKSQGAHESPTGRKKETIKKNSSSVKKYSHEDSSHAQESFMDRMMDRYTQSMPIKEDNKDEDELYSKSTLSKKERKQDQLLKSLKVKKK